MNKHFINELRKDLCKMHGSSVELFSRELVYNFTYLAFRVESSRFGGAKWQCAVEFLVHHLLDGTTRATIFSSPYDLGNSVQLEPKQLKQSQIEAALADYALADHAGTDLTPINIDDIIKKLKRFIQEITGRAFREYSGICEGSSDVNLNASVATKVLFTLYRFRREWPKFFLRYARPTALKASLELRDAHPLLGFDDVAKQTVALHADLKVALTYGMATEEVSNILPTLDRISIRFEISSSTSAEWLLIHATDGQKRPPELPRLSDIQKLLPNGKRVLPERLDKGLYTALVLREVENRVAAKCYINEFLESPNSGVPQQSATEEDLLSLALSRRAGDKVQYVVALAKLLQRKISMEEFDVADSLQQRLRFIIKSPFRDKSLNHLEHIASVITCLNLSNIPISLKAHWHGKLTTSNRPDYYLKKISSHQSLRAIPEFYQEYWFRRYTLILCTLMNAKKAWYEHNETEQTEYRYISDVLNTHELSHACILIDNYFDKFPKQGY